MNKLELLNAIEQKCDFEICECNCWKQTCSYKNVEKLIEGVAK